MALILLISIFSFVFLFVGCNINETVSEAVEKSYTVTVKGIEAVDYISEQIAGSQLGDEIGDDLASVRNALVGLKSTIVSIGAFVGAEIPVEVFSHADPILALDIATEDMIRSAERIE